MKQMRKRNKRLILIILLLVISLGYALLNATLTINGNSKITAQTWDIHWNNVQVTTGSVSIGTGDKAAVITPNDTTEVTYEVTLDMPGDFYEFTVDAVNVGTVDGMIDEVTSTYKIGNGSVTTITSNNLPAYLEYSVAYSDGTALAANQELKAGTTETYKVRVGYKRDISNNELVGTNQSIIFSFAVDYTQADSNAIAVHHPFTGYVYTTNTPLDDPVSIGEPLSPNIEKFNSGAETGWNIYLKHKLVNDIVNESYVEFVITDELAEAYEGMVAGTYALRGIDLYHDDESTNQLICNQEYDDGNGNCINPYYESNVNALKTAFGYNTHPERCNTVGNAENFTLRFRCSVRWYIYEARWFGDVVASDGDWACSSSSSSSECQFD